MIKRILFDRIKSQFGKTIVLLGARQTGKTTLLCNIANEHDELFLWLDCDDPYVRRILTDPTTMELRQIIGDHQLVFIDEAQRVKNIGLTLKIIHDQIPEVQLLVSGSSALELANEVSEPLTGRKWEYMLYPISWGEYISQLGYLEVMQDLELRIVYGMYPDVIMNRGRERQILRGLAGSNLYKDLLAYSGIRKPELLERLLQALALQIGNEVSFSELSNTLQVDKKTIRSYIQLLEKSFIIFSLKSFSRNSRNEISKNRKVYFYDNGLRNALIANFNTLELRSDKGALWENFLISERKKLLAYKDEFVNCYFWRTSRKQEIDFIEERNGKLHAYEFKWTHKDRYKVPKTFLTLYPDSQQEQISRKNFHQYLTAVD